jgi:hypothetical protein
LAAATGLLNLMSWSLANLDSEGAENIGLQACNQHLCTLVIGNVEVAKGEVLYSITCQGCNLTTHISSLNKDRDTLIVVQPPYVLVPTNSLGDWYANRDLQVVKEIKGFLLREKRMVGLITAGIAALVTTIATAATASGALTQAVQNAYYVNNLTTNVTCALEAQVQTDDKMDVSFNMLEVVVIAQGNELDAIKYRQGFLC